MAAETGKSTWVDDETDIPLITERARQLDSFLDAIADGKVTDAEVKAEENAGDAAAQGNRAAVGAQDARSRHGAAVRAVGLRHDASAQHHAAFAAADEVPRMRTKHAE